MTQFLIKFLAQRNTWFLQLKLWFWILAKQKPTLLTSQQGISTTFWLRIKGPRKFWSSWKTAQNCQKYWANIRVKFFQWLLNFLNWLLHFSKNYNTQLQIKSRTLFVDDEIRNNAWFIFDGCCTYQKLFW